MYKFSKMNSKALTDKEREELYIIIQHTKIISDICERLNMTRFAVMRELEYGMKDIDFKNRNYDQYRPDFSVSKQTKEFEKFLNDNTRKWNRESREKLYLLLRETKIISHIAEEMNISNKTIMRELENGLSEVDFENKNYDRYLPSVSVKNQVEAYENFLRYGMEEK